MNIHGKYIEVYDRFLWSCGCRRALLLLKKKRYQDQLLDKTETQISNLERMVRVVSCSPETALMIQMSDTLKSTSLCGHVLLFFLIKVAEHNMPKDTNVHICVLFAGPRP